ncbi:hypothetical protein PPYR_14077 [Photinus pyralis]|uniref:Uncharacterized protein n=1 Tax=Photinus pyralis TaxID=7054 RepID=A0A5N4A473_PHOPY|nr:hypothetical protein PPYR_14077 [Photinus pyralis]
MNVLDETCSSSMIKPLLRMVNHEPARNEPTHGRDIQMGSLGCNRERTLLSLPSFRYFHLTLESKTEVGCLLGWEAPDDPVRGDINLKKMCIIAALTRHDCFKIAEYER